LIRKIVLAVVALAAIAAAAGIMVFAAAFAVFALAREQFGPAGAAAVVFAAAALLILLIALALGLQAMAMRRKVAQAPNKLLQQLCELVREQPIISLGALAGAAVLALRNPLVIASVMKAVMNRRRPKA
jgi:uncharacterized PurR-regulated membrane protein YhhQ (DUF165 family)